MTKKKIEDKKMKFEEDDRVTYAISKGLMRGTVVGKEKGKILVVWDGMTEEGNVGKVSAKEITKT